MKGLELAARFYEQQIAPLIKNRFPALAKRHAAGLIGYGSDVLGHDDELSRDHEWGSRCTLWLSPADYRKYGHHVKSILTEELPCEFLGFPARFKRVSDLGWIPCGKETGGLPHVEVTTVSRYVRSTLGVRSLPPSRLAWLCIPEQRLLEFTRGRIFHDPRGQVSRLRQSVGYFPDDIWRFKVLYAWDSLRWHLDAIGLCAARRERLSAHLALQRSTERIIRLAFLLSRRYCPGTLKWVGRELDSLPIAKHIRPLLGKVIGLSDPGESRPVIESAVRVLIREQNRLRIVPKVELTASEWWLRGQVSFSLEDVIAKLRQSLPVSLRRLKIQGACDQWVTNDDVLCEPDQYLRFMNVYRR